MSAPHVGLTIAGLLALVAAGSVLLTRRGTSMSPASLQQDLAAGMAAPKVRIRACLSESYATNKVALFTLLASEDSKKLAGYITSSVKLIRSARRHSSVPFDAFVLEIVDKPLNATFRKTLQDAGWGICTVKQLPPPAPDKVHKHFMDQFTKLRLWNMPEYDTILYMDADVYVLGNIDGLLAMQLGDRKLGAAHDFWDKCKGYWCDGFNMGTFLIHPSLSEYRALMRQYENDAELVYNRRFAEQAFLNHVYKDKWHNIGFKYAANIAVYGEDRAFWDANAMDIRVLHYTVEKPWRPNECVRMGYGEVCAWWAGERGLL